MCLIASPAEENATQGTDSMKHECLVPPASDSPFLEGRRFADIGGGATDESAGTCYCQTTSPPGAALDVVRQCAEKGVRRTWIHRSFGTGSVSRDTVRQCGARGIAWIVGGCPMMDCVPVDPAHRCFRWLLGWSGPVPK